MYITRQDQENRSQDMFKRMDLLRQNEEDGSQDRMEKMYLKTGSREWISRQDQESDS